MPPFEAGAMSTCKVKRWSAYLVNDFCAPASYAAYNQRVMIREMIRETVGLQRGLRGI